MGLSKIPPIINNFPPNLKIIIFSPVRPRIISCSQDRLVGLWQVACLKHLHNNGMFQFFLQNIAVMYLCCLANHAKNVPPYCPSISCCSFCPRLTSFLKNNAFHISSPPYCRSWLHRNKFDFQVCDALCSSLRILNRTKSWH